MQNQRKKFSRRSRESGGKSHKMARGLGLLSIAIGVVEILGKRKIAKEIGMKKKSGLISAYGVREIVNGVAILSARNPAPFLWARVAGDGLDIVTLASRFRGHGSVRQKRYLMLAIAGITAVTALDVMSAQKDGRKRQANDAMISDYKKRSGFPRPPYQMRGIASDLMVPGDMRMPAAMSPALYESSKTTLQ